MIRRQKARLYVSFKNCHLLDATDALLEHIESAVTSLERDLILIDCRVTVEGATTGNCRVQVDVTLPKQRKASSSATGEDLCGTIDGAFITCARVATTA
jgi:hypothetical protein